MKIAIIGAGISGLGSALALSERHDVRVFERDGRIGGHAHTVDVETPEGPQWVDTGFIVFNERNYPNLVSLFKHLEVPTRWSDMSFGFSLNQGTMEYACDDLNKIFAQRWRMLDPRFIKTFRQILKFTRVGPNDLASGTMAGLSLNDWLEMRGFGGWFRERFLFPMGGAIWSTSLAEIGDFPAESFVRFFVNHDLMTGLEAAQRWRTVDGGSREYVRRLVSKLGPRVQPGRAVARVDQHQPLPVVHFEDGSFEIFDQVIMASHAPQSLAMLSKPDEDQRRILGKFRTSDNVTILHSDPALMPQRRRVWSSWNFLSNGIEEDRSRPAQVTYWMNRLQGIPEGRPLFVSLNPTRTPDPTLTHRTLTYAHPLFDTDSMAGQREMPVIQGRRHVWFAGAWLGYGFHEDGLRSGLAVAEALGARPEWALDTGTPLAQPVLAAAE